MAGAVSAGAYTAGVLDELYEVLDRWEKAKQVNIKLGKEHPDYDHSLPMHRVELEVLSGASAGGINAALSLHKILDDSYPGIADNNLLNKCWVDMADDDTSGTLEKMLDTGDMETHGIPRSLLNGAPIEDLADRCFVPLKKIRRPEWFSQQAEVVLTTTNLNGIPLNIHFDQADPNKNGHLITQHSSVFRFRYSLEKEEPHTPRSDRSYFTIHPGEKSDLHYLKEAALSTSAFPVGLPARQVRLPHKPYLRFRSLNSPVNAPDIKIDTACNYRSFQSIDGGLLNNEPYGWGLRLLKEKCETQYRSNRYAVIMIDPLPHKDPEPDPIQKNHFLNVMVQMFRALRNEVMLNPEGLAEAISLENRTKFLIAPRKGEGYPEALNRQGKVLASAPVSGFAGFIHRNRRQHDYDLGRRNCRDFLRFHFTLDLHDSPKRLLENPTGQMVERFCIYPNKDKQSKILHYPIIPDIRLKYARKNQVLHIPETPERYPDLPEFRISGFRVQYQHLINKRILCLARRTTGKWWVVPLFRLFLLRPLHKKIFGILEKEMQFYQLQDPAEKPSDVTAKHTPEADVKIF